MVNKTDYFKYSGKQYPSYKELLKNAPEIKSERLAPLNAKPKLTKGDTHKYRDRVDNPFYVDTYKVGKERGRLTIDA